MKNISTKRKIKIFETVLKLACTAVLADLFYIIAVAAEPILTLADARMAVRVPEMLRYMLLSAVIITVFSAAATYVIRKEEKHE